MAKPPSSVDRLPEEIREQIGRLRVQGRTIDEILAHLKALDVEISRSALGRHVKGLAALRERMEHSRNMAIALVDRFGDQADNRLQRLNLELMHSVVMQTITATSEDEDGELRPVTFSPEDAKFLAQALAQLASAAKVDGDRVIIAKREAAKEALKSAAGAVRDNAHEAGLSAATADFIMKKILGLAG